MAYLGDFFKKLFTKENIGTIIWMVLNTALICVICCLAFGPWGIPIAVAAYSLSILLALSPLGEWIVRMQTGCKKIKNPKIRDRLEPLFREVYAKAKAKNPELPDDIRLYINNEKAPNAFATGRKTVCCTRGLLHLSDDEIKGILAHEFGHLAHRDTDIILIVAVGNLFVNIIIFVLRAIIWLFHLILWFLSDNWVEAFLSIINAVLISFLFGLWTKLGVVLCMHSSRKNEYAADKYAWEIGYGRNLVDGLTTLSDGDEPAPKGLFASLSASHPETCDRVDELEALLAQGNGEWHIEDEIKEWDQLHADKEEQKDNLLPDNDSPAPISPGIIHWTNGEYAGASFPITPGETLRIGRDPATCSILLSNDGQVSRDHMHMRYDASRNLYQLTDTSSNGTWVNHTRLERGMAAYLPKGTTVSFGSDESFILN